MKRSDIDTDIARLIACFAVVLIHCCYPDAGWSRFYHGLGVFSVPLFAMLSGYYMLEGARTVGYFARKILHLFLLMLLWSGLYFLYEWLAAGRAALSGLGVYLLTEPIHLWYLYAAMALYLFTPVLAVFYRAADRRTYLYALALTFFAGSLVFSTMHLSLVAAIVGKMKLNISCGFVFCYLFGGYLRRFGCRKKLPLYIAGGAGLLLSVLGVLLTDLEPMLFWSFFAPGVLLYAAAVLVLVKSACARRPLKGGMWLHNWATGTLGVYLLHPLLILILQDQGWTAQLPAPVAAPLRAVLVFLIASAVVLTLRRVPLIKKCL